MELCGTNDYSYIIIGKLMSMLELVLSSIPLTEEEILPFTVIPLAIVSVLLVYYFVHSTITHPPSKYN